MACKVKPTVLSSFFDRTTTLTDVFMQFPGPTPTRARTTAVCEKVRLVCELWCKAPQFTNESTLSHPALNRRERRLSGDHLPRVSLAPRTASSLLPEAPASRGWRTPCYPVADQGSV